MVISINHPAIPFGSLVVLTSATGFIGSHVVDQVLAAGYRVHGTTRDVSKNSWLFEHFERKYGVGKFELYEVPDMNVDEAFQNVVKGSKCPYPMMRLIRDRCYWFHSCSQRYDA